MYITFTQWLEINNQICTSFLIKSTSFLSPSCWPGVCVEHIWQSSAFSTVTLLLSPQIHLLSAAGALTGATESLVDGHCKHPAVEHLWGNKGPNSNFNVAPFRRSEKHPVWTKHAGVSVSHFPIQEEMLQVNCTLTAGPPSQLLMKLPPENGASVFHGLSEHPRHQPVAWVLYRHLF